MTTLPLRAVVADDERPARSFLVGLLRGLGEVTVVAEAADGAAAVAAVERHRPDVVFLDLQMPEVNGLEVVRLLAPEVLPLIVFVTAYDDYAVRAFELNAVDYLTKPVEGPRLREAVHRVRDRLVSDDLRRRAADGTRRAVDAYDDTAPPSRLDRLPVRRSDGIVLVPLAQVSALMAEGELLQITTAKSERHTMSHPLKRLEPRLDPARFIRLSRGVIVNIDHIVKVTPLPGGTYSVHLRNGQVFDVSRLQSRLLRGRLLEL